MENPRGRSPRGFSTRIFPEFGVNILCSAEQSSAYCHYSSFFGRHNHSIFTPRGNIEYQYSPLGVILNIKNIRSNILHSTLVLWRQKTWNNALFVRFCNPEIDLHIHVKSVSEVLRQIPKPEAPTLQEDLSQDL